MGDKNRWRMGMKASSDGVLTVGSRWLYEVNAWRYPDAKESEAQGQDPDDNTADGADCIAATRYAIMTALKRPSFSLPGQKAAKNRDLGLEHLARKFQKGWQGV